jgi:hypothetical protein
MSILDDTPVGSTTSTDKPLRHLQFSGAYSVLGPTTDTARKHGW